MKKTWMPGLAGTINMAAGLVGLALSFGLVMVYMMVGDALNFAGVTVWLPFHIMAGLWWLTFPLTVCSALALAGGILAIQRKAWAVAMAGSFAALFIPVFLPGFIAILLTSLSRNEFTPVNGNRAPAPVGIGCKESE